MKYVKLLFKFLEIIFYSILILFFFDIGFGLLQTLNVSHKDGILGMILIVICCGLLAYEFREEKKWIAV